MKRLIRYLADITGVTREIEYAAYSNVGDRLLSGSYWFNGGMMYGYPINSVQNFMVLYGDKLKNGNYFPDISGIRDDIYRAEKEGLNLNIDREVYGYWDETYSRFLPLDKLEELDDPKSFFFGKRKEDLKPQLRIKWNNLS